MSITSEALQKIQRWGHFSIFAQMRYWIFWAISLFSALPCFSQGNEKELINAAVDTGRVVSAWLGNEEAENFFRGTADATGILNDHPFYAFTASPIKRPIWEKAFRSDDQLFYFFSLMLLFYATLRIVFRKYHDDLFTLFFRATLKQQQLREQMSQVPVASLLLNLLFVVSGGVYIFYVARYFHAATTMGFFHLAGYAALILTAIYLVKFIVLKTMGWVIGLKKTFEAYIFIVFMLNKVLGILLLPVLLLLSFPYLQNLDVLIPLSLVLLALFGFYRYLIAYRQVRNEINLSPLHFFIYLCGLEIAPLLVIGKVLFQLVKRV
jgi:hypothetical protein